MTARKLFYKLSLFQAIQVIFVTVSDLLKVEVVQ